MEFARMAEHRELFENVRDHHVRMRGVDAILVSSKEILDATDTVSSAINHRTHGDLRLIHVMLEYFGLDRVGERIFRTLHLRLVESHGTSDFRILVRGHHVRIESEHIMVTDAVGDAVSVQATTEHHGGGGVLLLVFAQNGCACESEEQRVGEGTADDLQHVAEGGAMAFVHDEDDASCSKLIQPCLGDAPLPCFHVAHLLDRGDDQSVVDIGAVEFIPQYAGVLRALHFRLAIGEATVFLQRLGAQFDSVHEKHDLVGVMRVSNELSRFEAGHGFSGTGSVPYIAAGSSWHGGSLFPIAFSHHVGDGVRCEVLVAAQHFEASIRRVGDGVEADELVRHGNGQQSRSAGGAADEQLPFVFAWVLPATDRLVVVIRPMEVIARVEFVRAGIGEVDGVVGGHGHEDLHETEQAGEHGQNYSGRRNRKQHLFCCVPCLSLTVAT